MLLIKEQNELAINLIQKHFEKLKRVFIQLVFDYFTLSEL